MQFGQPIQMIEDLQLDIVYLGENLVSWSSKKRLTISRSSTEAEYRSVASTTAEIIWLESFLSEVGIQPKRKPIIWDNLSTLSLSANPVLHSRMKYIKINFYFVHEKVIRGKLSISHLLAAYQRVDILTKSLLAKKFRRLKLDLKIEEGRRKGEGENPRY